jgi:uncharacterized protein YprB with RNaseH-like and TPR domain
MASLGERLARLSRQAGVPTAPPVGPPDAEVGVALPEAASDVPASPSLAERLDRMTRARESSRRKGLAEMVEATGAVLVADGLYVVESREPLPFRHGRVTIGPGLASRVSVPLRRGVSPLLPLDSLLFLDTETSGLAGGSGTFVFLLGLARFEGAALVVRQYFATQFAAEQGLLDALQTAVSACDCMVSFNGKSFDVPLLKTRYGLQGLAEPFGDKPHCDLLHAARRLLVDGWPDCRLRTTESRALGFDRVDDLPGSEVPAAWQRWLTHGDARAVPRILLHNREDLVSLAAIVGLLNSCDARAPLFGGMA